MPDRLKSIRTNKTYSGRVYQINPIYPEIPLSEDDLYVITSEGDRYDLLAQQFYKDMSMWWVIACANNHTVDSLVVEPGVQLRIPYNPYRAKEVFNQINKDR